MDRSEISVVGKRKLGVYCLMIAFDVVVLALAARVNIFQEFFFVADLFPFALSIITLVALLIVLLTDMSTPNSFLTRPASEIGLLGVLSIFWLAFNSFSTSRWQHIPMACSSIPSEYPDERGWCKDVQALKAFVWIQFAALLLTAVFLLRYVLIHSRRDGATIWKSPLSRYDPWASYAEEEFMVGRSLSVRSNMTDFFGRRNSAAFTKY